VIEDGKPLRAALSVPSTLLYELCHMTSNGGITDQKVTFEGTIYDAYGPKYGAALALASPDDAVTNADSYRWFAIAMYLNDYDWSRTVASRVSAANAKRGNVSISDDSEMDVSKRFKRKTASERRQINWLVEGETEEKDWVEF